MSKPKKNALPSSDSNASENITSAANSPKLGISSVRGQVDIARPGMVEGWLFDADNHKSPSTVSAVHNGRVIATTVANHYRSDLQSAKIGDGHHGFKLEIPHRISGGGKIEIVDAISGVELTGSPVEIAPVEPRSGPEPSNMLLIDLSDMLFYLEHHDHLSGIQRVQANIFGAIIADSLFPYSKIRVVFYKEGEQKFYEVPTSFIEELIADTRMDAAARRYKRKPDGRLHLEQQFEARPLTLTEAELERSALVMLGAAWVFPSYFHAVGRLRKQGVRFVPLVHDLIPIVMPTMCDKGTAEVFKIFIKRLVRNADHIVTVSQHTQRDLAGFCSQQHLECPPTSVAQNGQSLGAAIARKRPSPVQGDFVLFVSTIEGRKNHQLALRVWERLINERGADCPTLVFVGRLGWRVEGLVEQLHESNYLGQKVVVLSELADSDLTALYQNCLFTIYPSLYEGWGLPVGESLAFGKVCLASNTSSVPEAGGQLTEYFDPNNTEEVVQKVKRLIDDKQWRLSLEERIAAEFKPITWTSSAEKIIAAFTNALSRPNARICPELGVGEYSFGRISYLEGNVIHGDEVARHLRDFAEPHLTFRPLSLDHYIMADESLGEGIWYYPENWGRWGHKDGNSISFTTKDPGTDHVFVFEISVPDLFLPARVETSYRGRTVSSHTVKTGKVVIRLDGKRYRDGSGYDITFKLKSAARDHIPGDSRQLGVGFSRFALIEASSIEQRLEIIERQLFS